MQLCFRWVAEDRPGPRWLELLERAWPSYRRWFLKEGEDARPALATCHRALEHHMPELLPLWTELVELGDGSDELARMLSLYRPTPFLSGCSQAFWTRTSPLLVRNYDYAPASFEGVFARSRWLDTTVVAASDCLWGVLDGINEHGLAVALAFGGRKVVGEGFGIPLILRYVLETCRSVVEATAVLRRVPSHMSYNVSVLDASGARSVVLLAPDRPTVGTEGEVATNHQRALEWPSYDRRARSRERMRFLERGLRDPRLDAESFTALFLAPPLFQTDYGHGVGTLYTAAYSPTALAATWLWPKLRVEQTLADFEEREILVDVAPSGAARLHED